jgi:DNA-binding CsgD family transcriptional regulator
VAAAESEARAALEAVEHALVTPIAAAFLAFALIDRGEIEEAEQVLAGAGSAVPPPAMPSIHLVYARALVALLRGRWDDAASQMAETGEREAAFGIENPILGWRLGASILALREGRGDRARELLDELDRLAARWGSGTLIGQAMRLRATFGLAEDAAATIEAAVEHLRAGPDRLELARGLIDLGAALRREGRRVEARAPLEEALELGQSLGARVVSRHAHKELEVAGAKPRRLQFSGADALTAGERRVVELASQGRSNREIAQALFVTAKTVENHLGRAYRKLGVRSREELGDALAAWGSPTPAG